MTMRPNYNLQERLVFAHAVAGTPGWASCTITCDANTGMTSGNTVTIFDGSRTVTYVWSASAQTLPLIQWTEGAGTAAQNAATLVTAINAQQPGLVTSINGAVVTLTQNWDGSGGNSTTQNAKVSASGVFAITQWSGGQDAGGALQPSLGAQTVTKWGTAVPKAFIVDRVYYVNPTGFAANASAYWTIAVKSGSTVIASWSTQSTGSGGNGAITAGADTELVLNSTLANTVFGGASAAQFSVVVTPSGSPSALPAGQLIVEGRYVA